MTLEIATVLCGKPGPGPEGGPKFVARHSILRLSHNENNYDSPCVRYQDILRATSSDIVVYIHPDVEILDKDWEVRIKEEFMLHPKAVAVGLGGATSLGNTDLYRKQYNIHNMARRDYASNQKDAEVHGERFTGTRRVAVLDAFFMAVRREWLLSRGGWPTGSLTHHCLDLWLACEAARCHKEIWMTGLECNHYGGGASVGGNYDKAHWLQGGTLEEDHRRPHYWLYLNYADVLPIEVTDD